MPLVSIVMPVYNAEQYISEAIDSIINQSMPDWELIIINEPTTTDLTNEIVKRYIEKDNRIKLIVNKSRLGISKSLNVGLRLAKGKYIARMDADDISLQNRLEEQVKYMEAHPEIGISGCDYEVKGESWKSNLLVDEEEIKADLLFFVPLRHPTIIMRKDMLDKNNLEYSESFLAAEDYDLFVRSKKYFKISNLDKKLLIYRRHENATVYRMLKEGAEVNRILGRGMLEELGMTISDEDLELLYGHALLNERNQMYDLEKLYRFENLLEQIWKANLEKKEYDLMALFKVLIKRWNKETPIIRNSKLIKPQLLREYMENNVFTKVLYDAINKSNQLNNDLDIYMLVDSSTCNLIKGVKSVFNQSYGNWNLKVIGKIEDERVEQKIDFIRSLSSKIEYIPVEYTKILEWLKQHIKTNGSKYVSLITGHDYLFANRYELQINELEKNRNCMASICSVRNSKQIIDSDSELFKVNLLFEDYIDYSAVVLRRDIQKSSSILKNEGDVESCIECLLEENCCLTMSRELLEKDKYYTNICHKQSEQRIVDKFNRTLRLSINSRQKQMLLTAKEDYSNLRSPKNQKEYKKELKDFYLTICRKNRKNVYYNQEILESRLIAEWLWIIENNNRYEPNECYDFKAFLKRSEQPKLHLHNKIIIKFDRFCYNHSRYRHFDELLTKYLQGIQNIENKPATQELIDEETIKRWTWDRYKRTKVDIEAIYNKIERKVDQKVWDAERRIIVLDDVTMNLSHMKNRAPYIANEKIRIVIIFQVASFWPSIEFLYKELMDDERFEVVVMCYDEPVDSSIKTETARSFLKDNNIPFVDWLEFSMSNYRPHIVIIQTPYDSNRRKEFKSNYLKASGYRVVYIPYGMEIGDTQHSRKQQLDHIVRRYAWKIFTFSNTIHKDYRLYSEQEDNVIVTGLPKFDSLYHKELFPLNQKIVDKANGRKIVLWKVHFPKVADVNGKMELFTPDINEYIKFADYIENDVDNFYIFMPHPRFLEFNEDKNIHKQLDTLLSKLKGMENVFIDNNDDYRNSLLNAEAIIVDRSSVMVEAAAVGVPVLFMYNKNFKEPMTKAILPLIDSYYQGDSCQNMIDFIKMINKGQDTKKVLREAMFRECIPYFDGKCSERIKDELYNGLLTEK